MDATDTINKIILANCSPRYRRLERLESWFYGRQYDGKLSWWDDSIPLWDRAPCIVYPVVQIAIQSNVDLVLGEGRFPVFSGKGSEDESDEENGTSETEGQALDRFIVEYHKLAQFTSHAREAFTTAQTVGSAVALHGHRNGIPFADLIPAKTASPTFDRDGTVLSVDIRYPYVEEYQEPATGLWKCKVKLYRRTIDEKTDTTFQPADANATGVEPKWVIDTTRTIHHGLGFCPIVWYAFMKGCVPVNVFDGKALHEDITDEIHQHDIAVSQRHRCALFSEPQIYEIGVDKGSSPTEMGQTPMVQSSERGGRLVEDRGSAGSRENPLTGGYGKARQVQARKKGPGYVWQYENPDAKVGAITIPESALKFQDDNARDLLHKIENALGVVLPKPEDFKFASSVSGKSIEMMKQRQLDRCDQYRDDLRDNFLLPSVKMQLRIASVLGQQLKVSGADEIRALCAQLQETEVPDALDRAVA